MTEAIIYPCQTRINMFLLYQTKKKWLLKYGQNGGQNGKNWMEKCVLAILWLSVRCHPEGEYRPLLFLHSWTTQRPASTC